MPGSSPTMARRLSVSLLNRVDLPTLGRPSMTTVGALAGSVRASAADVVSIFSISDCNLHCSLLLGAFTRGPYSIILQRPRSVRPLCQGGGLNVLMINGIRTV